MAEQELIRRKCDWCDTVQEFNKHSTQFSAAERVQAEGWTVLVKVLFALGQIYPVQKHACKQSCAENIIKLQTFELPPHVQQAVVQEAEHLATKAAAAKQSGDMEVVVGEA
jgi:predicted nucleic acid-binding protein